MTDNGGPPKNRLRELLAIGRSVGMRMTTSYHLVAPRRSRRGRSRSFPVLQYTPAGVGKRISSGRIGLRYGVIGAMTDRPRLFAGPAVICWSGRQYLSASNPALTHQGN